MSKIKNATLLLRDQLEKKRGRCLHLQHPRHFVFLDKNIESVGWCEWAVLGEYSNGDKLIHFLFFVELRERSLKIRPG